MPSFPWAGTNKHRSCVIPTIAPKSAGMDSVTVHKYFPSYLVIGEGVYAGQKLLQATTDCVVQKNPSGKGDITFEVTEKQRVVGAQSLV